MPDSERLRRLDHDLVWHPFTPMSVYRDENAPIIVEGDGFHLIDTDGRRYLDGHSSLWCNIHGHRVAAIIRRCWGFPTHRRSNSHQSS